MFNKFSQFTGSTPGSFAELAAAPCAPVVQTHTDADTWRWMAQKSAWDRQHDNKTLKISPKFHLSIKQINDKLRISRAYPRFWINPSGFSMVTEILKIPWNYGQLPMFLPMASCTEGIGYPIEDRIKPGLDGALGRCARQPSAVAHPGIGWEMMRGTPAFRYII